MSNYPLTRLERIYPVMESSYGVFASSPGNDNACRFTKMTLQRKDAVVTRRDKTGTRSLPIGTQGKGSASWSVDMDAAPNGTAGIAPDCDPFLQLMFGQAGAATSGGGSITGATNATPIVVTEDSHGFANGSVVFISGVEGNTGANGLWLIGNVTTDNYTLIGSVGNGAYSSGGTSSQVAYEYTLSDNTLSMSLYDYRRTQSGGYTADQLAGFGLVGNEMTVNFGSSTDPVGLQFTGDAAYDVTSSDLANMPASETGGMTEFPEEPSAPVTNGGIIAGYQCKVIVCVTSTLATGGGLGGIAGGAQVARTATAQMMSSNTPVNDYMGTRIAQAAEADARQFGVSFSLYESDDTSYQNLTQWARTKTPVTLFIAAGTVSGSMMALVMNNLQLESPTREEQRRFIANTPKSGAHASSLTALDEAVLWFF